MAIIEELSDGVKDINLDDIMQQKVEEEYGKSKNNAATLKNNGDTAPELPAPLAEVKNQSVDEFVKSLNKMPFFMTEMDETADDGGENEALEALKALAYEGTPEEVAKNFKQQGNDCFKMKQLKDAREFYTKALAVKCGVKEIDEACLNNRAQCNLDMQNYGKTIRDCRDALKINPRNDKSWFRCAKGLLALDRLVEAEACIENALALKPSHAQVKELHEKVKKRRAYVEGRERAGQERERRQKSEKLNVEVALKGRNVRIKTTPTPPDLPDGVVIKLENSSDPTSTLLFPTIFLYPLAGQSDFVTELPENGTLDEQLSEILAISPDWDRKKEYISNQVDAYMETRTGGLIKVGKKAFLLEALSNDKVEVSDQLVRILIVPRARSKEFIDDWKNRMNK